MEVINDLRRTFLCKYECFVCYWISHSNAISMSRTESYASTHLLLSLVNYTVRGKKNQFRVCTKNAQCHKTRPTNGRLIGYKFFFFFLILFFFWCKSNHRPNFYRLWSIFKDQRTWTGNSHSVLASNQPN